MPNTSDGPSSSTVHLASWSRRSSAARNRSELALLIGLPGLLGLVVANNNASAA